jgi:hypothetical protein
MDREILKYLYSFFKAGDFLSYHSLNPIFDKLKIKNGQDFKYFNERLKTVTFYIRDRFLIEIDANNIGENNLWTVKKDKDSFYSYSDFDNPIKARITESMGVEYIEKIIEWEHQITVSESVKNTNNRTLKIAVLTLLALVASVYFSSKTVTSKELQDLNTTLQDTKQFQKQTMLYLEGIDASLRIMAKKDSLKTSSIPTK